MASGGGLARVTYLPGVVPPPSPETEDETQRSLDDRSSEHRSSEHRSSEHPSSEEWSSEEWSQEEWLQETRSHETSRLVDFASFFGAERQRDADQVSEPTAGPATAAGNEEPLEMQGAENDSRAAAAGERRREVRAEKVSMQALTRRGLSRWELQKTLLARELDEHIVEAELDRLEGVGLLDDAALAETFVRTQHERKGLGRGAIIAELRRRHIDQVHIDSALEQIDDDDEQSRATELAVKRAGQLSSYDLETAKRRLHGFLSRKGYNSSVVRAAIDEALSSRSVSSGSKSSSSKSSSSVSSSSKPSSSKSSSSGVRFR